MSNEPINKIFDNGFDISKKDFSLVALLSLKIAIKAYFSTYHSMRYLLHLFKEDYTNDKIDNDEIDRDILHSKNYCEACIETLIHFQHFIELICKNILRTRHRLLADDISNDHIIFDKLLFNEPLDYKEQKKLKSCEFFKSYNRLCTLIENGRIDSNSYQFLLNSKDWIEKLNYIRNRILHRGLYILRYPTLDELVGKYILPFIQKVIKLPDYSNKEYFWKYDDLACKIDPIDEIIKLFKSDKSNIKHVALLKEMGRAAYNNPYSQETFEHFKIVMRKRIEKGAKLELNEANISSIIDCPVCGINSLIIFDDIEIEDDKGWCYTWQAECRCCLFLINNNLDNPSSYGLPLPDYWKVNYL